MSFGEQLRADGNNQRASSANTQQRKVKFMINDQLVDQGEISIEKLDESNSMFERGSHEDFEGDPIDVEQVLLSQDGESTTKTELYLDELEEIDKLYEKIELDIAELATREDKEVSEIETMLESAAEQAVVDVGTGGLDPIVERDDEGGGEQADDEDNPSADQRTVAEEIERICQMK